MKNNKRIKLKELLTETTFFLGVQGLGTPAKPMDWSGKTIKEDEVPMKQPVQDLDKKKLLFGQDDEEKEISPEMKQAFAEAVACYNEYGKSIYREAKLKEVTETILQVGKLAEKIALAETDDWFDTQTVQRDMKGLNDNVKIFEKTAKDLSTLQHRLESCYENMGQILSRYFEINQAEQQPIPTVIAPPRMENKNNIKKLIRKK